VKSDLWKHEKQCTSKLTDAGSDSAGQPLKRNNGIVNGKLMLPSTSSQEELTKAVVVHMKDDAITFRPITRIFCGGGGRILSKWNSFVEIYH